MLVVYLYIIPTCLSGIHVSRYIPFCFIQLSWLILCTSLFVKSMCNNYQPLPFLCRENMWIFIHNSTAQFRDVPSGKRLHNYGKSPFLMGTLTISMAIFNSYVSHYQRVYPINIPLNHYKIPLNRYKIPLNHYKIPELDDWRFSLKLMQKSGADADASLRGGYQCAPCALGPRTEN